MTEFVTERMNSAFATPNAMTRLDVSDNNPLTQMLTMFWQFPAAFYQQRLLMGAQDTSSRGMGLMTTYVGLEFLHRSLRQVADPKGAGFANPEAVLEGWTQSPGKSAFRLFTGALPLTGLFPLGGAAETTLFGAPLDTNIAEGGMEKLLKGIHDSADPSKYGSQAALEWNSIFNYNAAR